MLKILQARLHQNVNCELPDVQAGFRKGRGTRDQIANIPGSSKKQESSIKISISALLTMPKPLTVWITINCGKFWKRWEYQATWPASWETCMQVRKQQLELDMEQTGSKKEKEYVKAVYCHPAYLTSMQNISCEMLGGWLIAGIKIAGRNINNFRYVDDTTLMAESEEELKSFLMRVKEDSEKSGLKTQHSKNEDHGIQSHHFMANRWGNSDRLYFIGLQNHCRLWLQSWNLKNACPLERKPW